MLFLTACSVPVALMLMYFRVANAENWAVLVSGDGASYEETNIYQMNLAIVRAMHKVNKFPEDRIITISANDIPVAEFTDGEFSVVGSTPPSVSTQDIGFHAIRSVLRGSDFSTYFGNPVVKSTRSDNIFFYYSGPCDEELIFIRGIGVTPGALREALFEMATFDSMLIVVDHPNSGRFLRTLDVPARVYAIASVHHTAMSGMRDMIEKPFTVLWARRILQNYAKPLSEIMWEFSWMRDITLGIYGDETVGERWASDFLFYTGNVQEAMEAIAMRQ